MAEVDDIYENQDVGEYEELGVGTVPETYEELEMFAQLNTGTDNAMVSRNVMREQTVRVWDRTSKELSSVPRNVAGISHRMVRLAVVLMICVMIMIGGLVAWIVHITLLINEGSLAPNPTSDTKDTSTLKSTDGGWSTWNPWSSCSATCGNGFKTRSRDCTNPTPSAYGKYCSGKDMDIASCSNTRCPASDGGWSTWNPWSSCSAKCGNGFKSRSRDCTNPTPTAYGKFCSGKNMDIASCNNNRCPASDGGWSTWDPWSSCSVTCGNGFKTRSRDCTNPTPSAYGKYCSGKDMDIASCSNNPCPDGGWSTWDTWSSCSATCGNGFKTRSRDCTNPTPSAYGKYCSGQPTDIASCSNTRCPDITSSFSVTEPKSLDGNYLTFSKVIYNLGADFNPSTGIFTCTKPGVYMFTFILVKKRAGTRVDYVYCTLRKNSDNVIRGRVDPTDDDTDKGSAYAGNTAIIHLNRDDTVKLYGCSDPPSTFMEPWTSFSGFLLYPDV